MSFEISGATLGGPSNTSNWFKEDFYKEGIRDLANAGGNYANFKQIYFQRDWSSSEISAGSYTQSDESLASSINYAKSLGLKTSIYIQIETTDVDAALRHTIDPSDPVQWFKDYKVAALHVANIAAQSGVDFINLGGELHKMSTEPEFRQYWVDIIASVRSVYDGKIGFLEIWTPGYAPVESLTFASDLDMVGLSFYNPTSSKTDATVVDMVSAWFGNNRFGKNYVEAIKALHEKYEKPIYFGEISTWGFDGATTQFSTNSLPDGIDWRVPGSLATLPTDLVEQANYFEAAYRVWAALGDDWLEGFLWWDWFAEPNPKNAPEFALQEYANIFSPNGKPAAEVIAYWNSNQNDPTISTVRGSTADDFLIGRNGNESFLPVSGNDYINGLAGIDTVELSGSRATFQVTIIDGQSIAQGLGQTHKLVDIERLTFSDGILALDVAKGQTAGVAYRIYKAAFARTPDNDGLKNWIGNVDNGMSLLEVAGHFSNSIEFRSIYGANPTTMQIVQKFYQNVLGRDGEADGVTFWSSEIDSGRQSVAQVLAGFSESPENIAGVAPTIADGIFYS